MALAESLPMSQNKKVRSPARNGQKTARMQTEASSNPAVAVRRRRNWLSEPATGLDGDTRVDWVFDRFGRVLLIGIFNFI